MRGRSRQIYFSHHHDELIDKLQTAWKTGASDIVKIALDNMEDQDPRVLETLYETRIRRLDEQRANELANLDRLRKMPRPDRSRSAGITEKQCVNKRGFVDHRADRDNVTYDYFERLVHHLQEGGTSSRLVEKVASLGWYHPDWVGELPEADQQTVSSILSEGVHLGRI